MARIELVGPRGLYQRFVFWLAKRELGATPDSLRAHAHHGRVFGGIAAMERALHFSGKVPERLKALVELRVATRVGCPY